MAILTSIVFHDVWQTIKAHLHIDEYARDRGPVEPRIRIGFVDLAESLSRQLVMLEMPCVACQRPIHPLRRRVDDDWNRLYYAPCCPVAIRAACSRSRAAMLEYQRFAGLDTSGVGSAQLPLFG
jgi:hypothetical protein